ncbi:MAG: TPM domain-containing protein [Myxococcaceae bacterium]
MRALPAVLLAVASLTASAADLNTIPEPQPGTWIVDTTHRIPAADVAAANALAESVWSRKLGAVGVVIIDTTNGVASRTFAELLHRRFNLGTGRGDGILFLAVLDDHRTETLLPFGLRDPSDQARSEAAMSNIIVPAFKRGAPGDAIREGTRSLVQLLEQSPLNQAHAPIQQAVANVVPTITPETLSAQLNSRKFLTDDAHVLTVGESAELEESLTRLYADGKGKLYVIVADANRYHRGAQSLAYDAAQRLGAGPDVQVALFSPATQELAMEGSSTIPALRGWASEQLLSEARKKVNRGETIAAITSFVSAYEHLATSGPNVGDYGAAATARAAEFVNRYVAPLIMVGVFAALALLYSLLRYLRLRPRRCATCHDPRTRLGELADDRFLNEGQRAEERAGSVDYDVWWCARCSDTLIIPYRAWFSGYSRCPACRLRLAKEKSRTLYYATTESCGSVEVTMDCTHCGHHSSYVHSTPRLQRSSSSSSSSSFGGGSSSGGGSSFGGSSGSW